MNVAIGKPVMHAGEHDAGIGVKAVSYTHLGKPLPKSGSREAGFLDEMQAWREFADGRNDSAVRLLAPIADREDKEGKGEVELPIRESLADMLLLSGEPGKALEQYEISLKANPNRFNALLGAGRAAEQLDRQQIAREFYRQLLTNCSHAEGPAIAALAHARELLARTDARP